VAASGQDTAPSGGFKFALWQINTASTGLLVAGSVISQPTMVAGWNYVPLSTPLLLTPCFNNSHGAIYEAAVGYTAGLGFPSTAHQFGSGNPYSAGITNNNLVAPSSNTGSAGAGAFWAWTRYQAPYSTAGNDPSTIMPGVNDVDDNLWLDVQVQDTAPVSPTPTYRTFPNSPAFVVPGTSAQNQAYTLGLQFSVSQTCTLTRIWHYSGSGATVLPTRCGLWNVSTSTEVVGSDNSSPTWSGAAGSGWVSVTYASGPTLSPGVNYKVSTFTSDNTDPWFLASDHWWGGSPGPFTSGITQGPLVVPGTASASPGQDSWNLGIVWTYPNTSTSPEFDGLDVEVTPAGGVPLTGSITSVSTLAGTLTSTTLTSTITSVSTIAVSVSVIAAVQIVSNSSLSGVLHVEAPTVYLATVLSNTFNYTAGQIAYSACTFTDINGNLVDPPSVSVDYKCSNLTAPVRNLYTGSATPGTGYPYRLSVGQYVFQIDTTLLVGYLQWEWYASGSTGHGTNTDSAIIYPATV
jgi:hypothetical protein